MMEASVITESTSSRPYKMSVPQGILYGDVYFLAPSNPSKSLSYIMNHSWSDGLVLHNSIVVREVDLHSHDEWLHRAFKAPERPS